MRLHGSAKLTPFQRDLLCVRVRDEGWTVEDAAEAAGCAERTVPSVGITQCACVVWMYTLPESSESPRWSIEPGQCRNLREPNETRRKPKSHPT